jgi:Leucine-rich repeat (LRR) protein
LNLSENLLEDICPEIEQLTALINLQLSGNKLKQLPEGIRGLTNLTKLSLDINKIKELPKVLLCFVISWNPLKSLTQKRVLLYARDRG